ncbi:MAG TPA: hypothetical protein VG754_02860 [Verrucomicrobiae bacterium]|nr:hypothetical protein [Verrucomicrobiae bacterium]
MDANSEQRRDAQLTLLSKERGARDGFSLSVGFRQFLRLHDKTLAGRPFGKNTIAPVPSGMGHATQKIAGQFSPENFGTKQNEYAGMLP